MLRLRPAVSIWYHQPWNAVLGGCHHVGAIRRRYARIAHMRNSCRGHDLVGTAIKWENHTFPHATAFVVELRDRPLSAAMVSRNARAVMALARGG